MSLKCGTEYKMRKIKCKECGQVFNDNLNECPNCGCPASECEELKEEVNHLNQKVEEPIRKVEHQMPRLVECPDCGVQISSEAKRCPHCGAKGKYTPMDFGDAIYDCFCRKYFCFTGRSRRSEVFPFLIMVGMMCGTLLYFKQDGAPSGGPIPEWLPFLITLLPTLGAIVRRLHDIGRNGWWVLCPIIPEIFIFKDSDKVENEYGKSPKYQPEFFTEILPDRGTDIAKYILIVLFVLIVLFMLFLRGIELFN